MAEGLTRKEAMAMARQMLGEDEDDGTLLLPASEIPLIRLVSHASGQWRMGSAGMAGMRPIAFDLTALDVAARWLGITPDARLLNGLSIIEREALNIMRAER